MSSDAREGGVACERCQGNGEIVTDWERYLQPRSGDVGDEAVTECPDCDGYGVRTPLPRQEPQRAEVSE